ncbi:DUF397 domain-containing protein [Streptomyces sp. 35G-GA-8]|uniref:DUF397 domain-containing protein n=1 Tax=Streptomyces sp. 35G-GA-8 TaxID=2939434 RepID=UPI0027E56F5E|nr:DUF397 domain-containing protein [Streptomyces sp. 35G-GA-8]
MPESAWFKSSYSDGTGNNCIEVANVIETHSSIAVRDSKYPNGPALLFTREAFTSFAGNAGRGTFNPS